jgi:hypothetical protein
MPVNRAVLCCDDMELAAFNNSAVCRICSCLGMLHEAADNYDVLDVTDTRSKIIRFVITLF